MKSRKIGGILGAIVAAIVLGAAVAFGPLGQFGKPPKPAAVPSPSAGTRARRTGAARTGDPGGAELRLRTAPLAEHALDP